MSTQTSRLGRREFLIRASALAGAAATGTLAGGASGAAARAHPWAEDRGNSSRPEHVGASVVTPWFELMRTLVRTTPGFTPPVASRAFAYAGITVYEAVAPGSRRYRSLGGVLPGMPRQPGADNQVSWPVVANAGIAQILRALFPTASDANMAAIDELESSADRKWRRETPRSVYERSVDRGQRLARRIFDWSASDGGHEGFKRNFPPDYVPPVGQGLWVPTPPRFQPALQPYWGENRCFVIPSGAAIPAGAPTPYSAEPGSAFYRDAIEVYDAVNNRTPEQEEIAFFWSDDPGLTATPPGHSISITTQALRRERASLMEAAEAYAKVGIAVADAFIACWYEKYRYNLVRPVTYVRAVVEPTWLPILETPPFPEHPSGHSVQSGAAFHVLTDLFGDNYAFTDRTHDDRGLPRRRFTSFAHAGEEAALSRLYGGIHYRPAIALGLEQGRRIGAAVNALPMRSRKRRH